MSAIAAGALAALRVRGGVLAALDADHADGAPVAWSARQLLELEREIHAALVAALAARRGGGADTEDAAEPPLVVGLFLSTSAAYAAAALACLRAGAAFMPLDAAWPPRRLAAAAAAARPAATLWAPAGAAGGLGPPPADAPLGARLEVRAAPAPAAAASQFEPPQPPPGPAPPFLYLLFTSGSTGAPLGVRGAERALLRRLAWQAAARPWRAGDVAAAAAAPAFVDSVAAVLGPLLAGVPLLALAPAVARRPAALLAALAAARATHLAAVPTLWAALADAADAAAPAAPRLRLRLAVSSGEPLPRALAARLRAALLPPGCALLNIYGCTEAGADSTWHECGVVEAATPGGDEPAGAPIDGAVVAIADPASLRRAGAVELLPRGRVGAVLLGGAGLADGYLADGGAATAARFVRVRRAALLGGGAALGAGARAALEEGSLAGSDDLTKRMFDTGDLGALDAGGVLWLHGRAGLQVKVAGARVDLREVEAAAAAAPGVAAAAARAWPLPGGGALLAVYVEAAAAAGDDAALSEERVRAWCAARLAPPAVPGAVVRLAALPRGPAGKLDRGALPPLPAAAAAAAAPPPPKRRRVAAAAAEPPGEAAVAAAFARALGHAGFEATTPLLAAGGTSLAAAALADELGLEPGAVYRHSSVRALAAHLKECASGGGAAAAAVDAAAFEEPPARPVGAPPPPGRARALRLAWRAPAAACVDAPPLAAAGAAAFACSHAGEVLRLDAATGGRRWAVRLTVGADAGMCLFPAPPRSTTTDLTDGVLAVADNAGALHLLDSATGAAAAAPLRPGGALRAPPARDPWAGRLWAAGHGGRLLVAEPCSGAVLQELDLGAPASAGVVFDAAACRAYLGLLDGSLVALAVGAAGDAAPAAREAWRAVVGAPLLAPPAPLPGGGVAAAAADGSIAAFGADGAPLWRARLKGGVFAAPLLAAGGAALVAVTDAGALAALDPASGRVLFSRRLAAGTLTALVDAGGGALLAAAASGLVLLLAAAPLAAGALQVLDAARLPAGAFAAAPAPGGALLGCRDDAVYMLACGVENE
jgi:non-ribosomal peptide synthetase component F/outer membrane protein assembly factor BamB